MRTRLQSPLLPRHRALTTLIEARDERSFLRLKAQLAKLDLLVLDQLKLDRKDKSQAD